MKSIKLLAAIAALAAPISAAQAVQGLNGKYFTGQGYPNPTTGTPSATFLTNTVCFPNCGVDIGDGTSLSTFLGVPLGYTTNLSQDFNGVGGHSLTLTGFIKAVAGNHNFALYSDDGSQLFIDGNLVVDNGGQHAPQTAGGSYSLTAGYHSILIYQDENGGGTALTAYMDGNALSGSILSTVGNVPEPATWGLMIGGFGVVGAASRRRRTMASVTA